MTSKKQKLDLSKLKRFLNLEDKQDFKMIKIGSKREGSRVGIGQYETGYFSLQDVIYKGENLGISGFITGNGFSFLQTSPIVKIVESDDISTTFETEGGIYKVQMHPKPRSATKPVTCHKCKKVSDMKDLTMKMGGLLCPKCRVILFEPYVNEEFFDERARRNREESVETEKNNSGDGQEST